MRFDLSDIFVRFRDLGQVWKYSLQAGLYATPIIYPITFIADRNPWAAVGHDESFGPNYSRHAILLIDKANTLFGFLVENKFLILIPYVLPILFFCPLALLTLTNMLSKFAEIL